MDTPANADLTLKGLGFLEVEEVAAMVGAKPLTLRNWRCKGIGPAFTRIHGNRVVYPIDGVKKWLLASTVNPNAAPTLIHGRKQRRPLRASETA